MSNVKITGTEIQSTAKIDRIVYFKGLSAFRFIAASLVIFVHLDDAARDLNMGDLHLLPSSSIGGNAVTFFFVLSGFLITYLLMEEKKVFRDIDIRKFYWRRVLRIWPLYYLIAFLAFAIFNNNAIVSTIADPEVYQKSPANILLYLVFLPNVAWVTGLQILYANQLWSVGVEEQFYLFWPLVIKYLGAKKPLYFMIALIIGYLVLGNSLAFLQSHHIVNSVTVRTFSNFLGVTRIDCMAIGGIGAYLFHRYPEATLRLISSKVVDVLVSLVAITLLITGLFIPYAGNEVLACLFCYIILSASCKQSSILQIENRLWNWLGKLSYGIYMWHMVVMAMMVYLFKGHYYNKHMLYIFAFYFFTFGLTILVAYLSYEYIEKPFLRIKHNFILVKSRAS